MLRISRALLLGLMLGTALNLDVPGAHARWATPEEASYAVNFEKSFYHVHRDGSFSIVYERQVEILNDSGRVQQGMTRLTFDSHASHVQVIEARTVNPDRTIPVDSDHIEIKPLASQGEGFDETSQLTIAFPDVRVGSKLYFKYKRIVEKPQIPDFFSLSRVLGWGEYVQGTDIVLDSEAPLYIETHDPEHQLGVDGPSAEKSHHLGIHLQSPTFKMVFEEEYSFLDPDSLIWITVSTAKDWSRLTRATLEAYEEVIHSPLPSPLERIYRQAEKLSSDTDRINSVTSALEDSLRYVGDWIPIEGAYYPRPLARIVETGFGDCKDFTVAAASILARLGFQVNAAWVIRGKNPTLPPTALPAQYFNHAIVYARRNGREYWIDPTNNTSFAHGLYDDIADRPALVLIPGHPEMKRIPPMKPEQGRTEITLKLDFNEKPGSEPGAEVRLPSSAPQRGTMIDATGELLLSGRSAVGMTGSGLAFSKKHLDFTLVNWIANAGRLESWSFGDYDLSSRTVRDLKIPFQYQERWHPVRTSAGPGYLVPAPSISSNFLVRPEQRVSDLQLDDPGVWRREYRFEGKQPLLKKELRCEASSRWMDFTREFRRDHRGVVLSDKITLKRSRIGVKEMRTPMFEDMRQKIAECLQEAVMVFR